MEADDSLCGIDGPDDEPVTKHELNRFVRRAMAHHIRPLTLHIRDMNKILDDHIRSEELQMAKINQTLKVVGIGLACLMTVLNSDAIMKLLHWHP